MLTKEIISQEIADTRAAIEQKQTAIKQIEHEKNRLDQYLSDLMASERVLNQMTAERNVQK